MRVIFGRMTTPTCIGVAQNDEGCIVLLSPCCSSIFRVAGKNLCAACGKSYQDLAISTNANLVYTPGPLVSEWIVKDWLKNATGLDISEVKWS